MPITLVRDDRGGRVKVRTDAPLLQLYAIYGNGTPKMPGIDANKLTATELQNLRKRLLSDRVVLEADGGGGVEATMRALNIVDGVKQNKPGYWVAKLLATEDKAELFCGDPSVVTFTPNPWEQEYTSTNPPPGYMSLRTLAAKAKLSRSTVHAAVRDNRIEGLVRHGHKAGRHGGQSGVCNFFVSAEQGFAFAEAIAKGRERRALGAAQRAELMRKGLAEQRMGVGGKGPQTTVIPPNVPPSVPKPIEPEPTAVKPSPKPVYNNLFGLDHETAARVDKLLSAQLTPMSYNKAMALLVNKGLTALGY